MLKFKVTKKKGDSISSEKEDLELQAKNGELHNGKDSTSCGESIVSKDSDLGSLSTENDLPPLSPGNDITVTSDCGRSLRSDQSSVYSGGCFVKKTDSFEDSAYMIESSQSSSSGIASDDHHHDSHSFSSHGNQEDNEEFFHQCRLHVTRANKGEGGDHRKQESLSSSSSFERCRNGRLPIPRRGKTGHNEQEYSTKMVESHPQGSSHDLSHDSSSGVESGEAQNLSDSSPNASLKGDDKSYSGPLSGHLEQLHGNKERATLLHADSRYPLHQRDMSWSSFTDSDVRGGSVFSSSDTDNNLPLHQKQAMSAVGRKTPILHKPPKPSKAKSAQALKCKKHVTFKAPSLGEAQKRITSSQDNGHFRDSNILYYEDDEEDDSSDQYYRQVYQETDLDNPSVGPVLVSHTYHHNRFKGQPLPKAHALLNGHAGPAAAKQSQGATSSNQILTEAHVHIPPQEVAPQSETGVSWSSPPCSHGSHCTCNPDIRDTDSPSSDKLSKPSSVPNGSQSKVLKRQGNISHIGLLPDDVLVRIFSHLPSNQLCQCSAVSRQWYSLSWEPSLWTTIKINSPTTNVDRALKHLTRRLSYDTPGVCVMVEKINLNGCSELTDRGLYTIAKKCVELRQLEVQGCVNITNIAMFELVSRCVNLEHLNASGCDQITCISLTPQATVQAQTYGKQMDLRYLDMSECYHLDDSGLQIIASYCTQLVYLYLRRCVKITDIGVQYVANYCSNIKELSVCDCRKVSDFGMKELAKLGNNLRYLSVAKCDNITDAGVKHLAKYCRRIRYLNLRGCEGVSDESVDLLAKNCSRLRSLDIGKCDVTDEGLQKLADHSSQLRKLSLKSCDAVTDKGVMYVAEKCRHLQQLNIQECHLTVHAYRTVKKLCSRCIIEHTNPGFY